MTSPTSRLRLVALAALSTLSSAPAFAHPGHGSTEGTSLLHYLAEPAHAAVLAAVVAAGVLVYRLRMSRKPSE